jgi:hypothetical protein
VGNEVRIQESIISATSSRSKLSLSINIVGYKLRNKDSGVVGRSLLDRILGNTQNFEYAYTQNQISYRKLLYSYSIDMGKIIKSASFFGRIRAM